jgi:lipid-A-disaccharide synthase-like uncharacterized protein
MSSWIVISIGAIAQILFSSRLILQWLLSEKHKKVLTPVLFWEFSLLASFLLFLYGYLRDDFAIMLGQVITYYIYIRNIQLQDQWKKFPKLLRLFIYAFPVIILCYGYNNGVYDRDKLFHNEHIPVWLFWLGIFSQVLFTFRFVYQWLYSERRKESHLPLGFWIISLSGSFFILVYASFRKDPVLLAGQLTGFIVYLRNIVIIQKNK